MTDAPSPADEMRDAAFNLRNPFHRPARTVGIVDHELADPLADWLDETARAYEAAVTAARTVYADDPDAATAFVTTGAGAQPEALAVARAINHQEPR